MVAIYYRTLAAIASNPVAFAPPDEGLDKDDYEFVTRIDNAPTLEEVFRMMMNVDGSELPVKLGVRSMMPGDVVVDEDGDVWFCAATGWERSAW
jgi:hypothetical protein